MVPELRKEEILKSIKKRDISYIKDLAAELNISLSTVRRDVAALEQEGSVIVMRGGAVKYKAEDFDEPVVKKKLIHSEEKEIIARKAAALVEDGDCVYVDSGTTTVGMLKYLQENVSPLSPAARNCWTICQLRTPSVSCWEERCGMIWNPYWAP